MEQQITLDLFAAKSLTLFFIVTHCFDRMQYVEDITHDRLLIRDFTQILK